MYYFFVGRYKSRIGNRIVLYHSIGSVLDFDTYGISVSKKRFAAQLDFLINNYEIAPITPSTFEAGSGCPNVSICFDDGYKDNLYAFDLCERYSIPYTLYLTTGFLGKKCYLSADEIKDLASRKLCSLGTHTVTHRRLSLLTPEQQLHELKESKLYLEEIAGREIDAMSYPHGSYDANTVEIAQELGYKTAATSNIGMNGFGNSDLMQLKRIEIIARDGIESLRKKLLGYYDFL